MEMEGDASMVVASIQKDTYANFSQFGHIIDGTWRLLLNVSQEKVSFYKREANKVAHRLARFSLTSILDATWFEDLPDIILYVLVEDKI